MVTTRKLDLASLSRNIGATFARQILAAALGLVPAAIIAHAYGPEGTGTFAIAMLLSGMLVAVLNLGVTQANVYYLGAGRVDVRSLLRANVQILLRIVMPGLALASIGLAWKGGALFPGVSSFVIWIAVAGLPIGMLNGYLLSIFQGLQRFRTYNLILILQPAMFLVFVGMLAVAGSREINLVVGVYWVSQLIVLAVSAKGIRPFMKDRPSDVQAHGIIRRTLDYGWKAYLNEVLLIANYRVDLFLVNLVLGPAAVGIYAIASTLSQKLWLLSQAVSTVLLPRLSALSADESTRRALTPLVSRWVLLVTLLAASVLGIVASPVVALLFGHAFAAAVEPLWYLLPGCVMLSASRVLTHDIAARGRPELNMYIAVIVFAANVTGNWLMIHRDGLRGAAIATTAAYALDLFLRLVIYGRLTSNPWLDSLIVRRQDIRVVLGRH